MAEAEPLLHAGGEPQLAKALEVYDKVVALAPEYAEVWAGAAGSCLVGREWGVEVSRWALEPCTWALANPGNQTRQKSFDLCAAIH